MKKLIFISFLGAILILCSCGSAPQVPETTPTEAYTPVTIAETETTTEDYEIIEPYSYEGSGDTVLELEPRDDIWGLFIQTEGDGFFAVTGYDEDNNYVDLFVNTTAPYSGLTFDNTLSSKYLEIEASGDWTVEQIPAAYFDVIGKGETYERSGDWVLLVADHGISAHITGNSDGGFFSVISYDNELHYDELLVNTADPYDGNVHLDSPAVFAIKSENEWSITLED